MAVDDPPEHPEHSEATLIAERGAKAQALRNLGVNPYPNGLRPTATCVQVVAAIDGAVATPADPHTKEEFTIAGRVVAKRSFGKAAFLKMADRSGRVQTHIKRDVLSEVDWQAYELCDTGDIILVTGPGFRTKTGEATLLARQFRLLSKAVRALPEKWHGLRDVETRYRQRYVDLIVNEGVAHVFRTRAQVVRSLRAFLDARDFVEVETPMMHAIQGGAAARPFRTHHNALDLNLFLRIAPELYLKRLIVGGLERVYEIGRNFRNEGISRQHNPEFTMLEFYMAYATYQDLMQMTEEMIVGLARELYGLPRIVYQGKTIDLTPPWPRVAWAEVQGDEETIRQRSWERPVFLHQYPVETSPLARRNDTDASIADRFELFIGGMEMANAFSELNDPADQRQRFESQLTARHGGDEEAMEYDEDYCRALEFGMPPTAGEGIGIDRLVMLLCDQASIRDVILFPLLRPES